MGKGSLRAHRAGRKQRPYKPKAPRETDLLKKYSRAKNRRVKQRAKWEVQ